MKSKFLILLFSAATIFTSCKEETPGNGRIKLAANTTSSQVGNVGGRLAAANDLVFTSGTITIREVVFDGDNENQSISRTIAQVADIDYATGTVSPAITIEVPPGNYTSVNLGIEMQDVGAAPSTVIEGTFTNANLEAIPLRFEFNSGEVFEATAASVSIAAGADIIGKVSFDALDWFSTVTASELANATLTDGTIIVSESSNSAIFDKVAARLDVGTQAVFE
jgi:hypothetical protein